MQNRLFRNDVLARVRTNRVYIEIKGMIPGALLQCLRDTYGRRLILHLEYGKRMHNILEAPLYEQEPEEMNPGALLRFFRQDNGLSQAMLGKKLGGVSRQNVSHMDSPRENSSGRPARRVPLYSRRRTE